MYKSLTFGTKVLYMQLAFPILDIPQIRIQVQIEPHAFVMIFASQLESVMGLQFLKSPASSPSLGSYTANKFTVRWWHNPTLTDRHSNHTIQNTAGCILTKIDKPVFCKILH